VSVHFFLCTVVFLYSKYNVKIVEKKFKVY